MGRCRCNRLALELLAVAAVTRSMQPLQPISCNAIWGLHVAFRGSDPECGTEPPGTTFSNGCISISNSIFINDLMERQYLPSRSVLFFDYTPCLSIHFFLF